jgi:hypothetical protein
MTQRIKQFYEQCNRVVDDPFSGAHISFDYQMFAELIVRECIQAVDNVGGYNEEFHMNAIKEHFGIEE